MGISTGAILAVLLAVAVALICGVIIGGHLEHTRLMDREHYGDDQPGRVWR